MRAQTRMGYHRHLKRLHCLPRSARGKQIGMPCTTMLSLPSWKQQLGHNPNHSNMKTKLPSRKLHRGHQQSPRWKVTRNASLERLSPPRWNSWMITLIEVRTINVSSNFDFAPCLNRHTYFLPIILANRCSLRKRRKVRLIESNQSPMLGNRHPSHHPRHSCLSTT